MIPQGVREEVEARLGPIRTARAVGGGCVNQALRVELGDDAVFLKYNLDAPPRMFAAEAAGLGRLREAATDLRVPEVLAVGDAADGGAGWLALEWLEPGGRSSGFARRLGRGLAGLHRVTQTGWGWEEDGFIGPLPQPNSASATWAAFWWERRLAPQLQRAGVWGGALGAVSDWDRLASTLPGALAAGDEDGPSLIHGDLWSGNVLAAKQNVLAAGACEPALVDPAAYHGHREVDLAMSELFGGFDGEFYAAYQEVWPLAPGYAEVRRYVYQLYFLLVHVNLFGGSYVGQTAATLHRVLAAAA